MMTRNSLNIQRLGLFLLFLLVINEPILSQDYIPFDFESGIWLTYRSEKESNTYHYQYYCDGDTMISGKYFHKLYEYKYVFTLYNPPYAEQGYYGAIVNDTVNKKVELIEANHTEINVIYDFDLEVGDTIQEGYGSEDFYYPPFVVQKIDTLELCGRNHRRYIIDDGFSWGPYDYIAYIEGIGHTLGLINPILTPFESVTTLECYTELNNNNCSECNLLLKKAEVEVQEKVRIYPNPSSGNFTVESKDKIESIEIFSINGSLAYTGRNLDFPGQLDIKLQEGIYLMRVRFWNAEEIMKKIILE